MQKTNSRITGDKHCSFRYNTNKGGLRAVGRERVQPAERVHHAEWLPIVGVGG
mgnify:CR=1 FL=1